MIEDDIIETGIDISYPLNIQLPLPIDPRQFFSSKDTADNAVLDAVAVDVIKDEDGSYMGFTLPSSEEGGRDSVYYYGEPIIVTNEDKTKSTLYVIVKNPETQKGMLESVGSRDDFYTKEETDNLITGAINNLDTDVINGFIYTQRSHNGGDTENLNALYRRGLKEVNGLLQLAETEQLIVQFDRTYPYSSENPLATVRRVNIVSEQLSQTAAELSILEEKVEDLNQTYGDGIEIEMLDNKGGLVNEYQIIGSSILRVVFDIKSSKGVILNVTITCGEITQNYENIESANPFRCIWENTVNETSVFLFTITRREDVVDGREKCITFVNPSAYGVISEETYENMAGRLLTREGNSMLFKHCYDNNNLDYISCYCIYGIQSIDEIIPYGEELIKEARKYNSSFSTEAVNGLEVNQRFCVIVPDTGYSEYEYLCYVKDDPCQINEFKQTFEP